jgi:hypothetical protein
VTGAATIDLPVTLQLPGEEDHALVVTLLPVDPVEINGHAFIGIQFAIPHYTGTGEIDLTSLAGDNWTESWDPLWFQLWLDNDDESFFWSPGYGRAVASIDASAEVLAIEMEMYDAASRHITVALSADLPPGSLRY